MDLATYNAKFPGTNLTAFRDSPGCRIIKSGVLFFNEDNCLGGAFPGNAGAYNVADLTGHRNLQGINAGFREMIWATWNAHHRDWQVKHAESWKNLLDPAKQLPVKIIIDGNDDAAYMKLYATVEEALAELELLEAVEDLDFEKDIFDIGFVYW